MTTAIEYIKKGGWHGQGALPVSEMQASDVRADWPELEADPTVVPVLEDRSGPVQDGPDRPRWGTADGGSVRTPFYTDED